MLLTSIELNCDRAGCKEGAATLKGAQGDVFSFTYSQDVMAGPSRCWHSSIKAPLHEFFPLLHLMVLGLHDTNFQVHLAHRPVGGGNICDGGQTGKRGRGD